MTPQQFVEKWSASTLTERQGAQSHFIDLCRMLGVDAPGDQGANTDSYTFEKGLTKSGGGSGWADVWKRGCFGWEYKNRGENLADALKQLKLYNERPAWLDHAHRDLDRAVAAAYGWTDWGAGLPDDVILERLFKLNQERAGRPPASGSRAPR